MSDRNPSPYTRILVLAGPALALLATICSLAAGSGLRLPGGRLVLRGPLEPSHGAPVRPVAGVSSWGLGGLHPLPAPRRARGAFRMVEPDRPIRLATRTRGAGTSQPRPGRTLPVAESPSRAAPPRGGAWPGGGAAGRPGEGVSGRHHPPTQGGARCGNPDPKHEPSSPISSAGDWRTSDTRSDDTDRPGARSGPCPLGRRAGARAGA